jgi:DEAD/DEAH box helicase domain-containing protein
MGSLHGIEHAFIALSPLFTLCDAADLGGITFLEHPQLQHPAIFVYDSHPGGIGLAARTYEILPDVLRAVAARLERCGCDSGCPGCVYSPRCGAGNFPLDKTGSRVALQRLLAAAPALTSGDAATGSAMPRVPRAAPGGGRPAAAIAPRPADAPRRTLPPVPCEGPDAPPIVCFDVETRYAAREVGGWKRIDCMGMALAVVFDARERTYTTYGEGDVARLVETLRCAELVVGFNIVRFDYRVLSAYTGQMFDRIPTFDMLLALKKTLGFRVGLGTLARATLGRSKMADGEQSLAWVRAGRLDLVEAYCRLDVALTWELFRHGLERGWLAFERKGVALRTPPLQWELDAIRRDAARQRALHVRGAEPALFEPALPRPAW